MTVSRSPALTADQDHSALRMNEASRTGAKHRVALKGLTAIAGSPIASLSCVKRFRLWSASVSRLVCMHSTCIRMHCQYPIFGFIRYRRIAIPALSDRCNADYRLGGQREGSCHLGSSPLPGRSNGRTVGLHSPPNQCTR